MGEKLAASGAILLFAGVCHAPGLHSTLAAFHVARGHGKTGANGEVFGWRPKTVSGPSGFAEIAPETAEKAFLVRMHDRPFQEEFG